MWFPLKVIPYTGYGSVTHFYHFLLSYYLPLVLYSLRNPRAQVVVEDCGPLNRWFFQLPSLKNLRVMGRPGINFLCAVALISTLNSRKARSVFRKVTSQLLKRPKRGSNRRVVSETERSMRNVARFLVQSDERRHSIFSHVQDFARTTLEPKEDLHSAVSAIFAELGTRSGRLTGNRPLIVLVSRHNLPGFYVSKESSNYGPTRRNIPNTVALAGKLAELGEVFTLSPEVAEIADLVQIIHNADVLVAQHGAGLANMVWMNGKSHVLEITYPGCPISHFSHLAELAGVSYRDIQAQNGSHQPVDIEQVSQCVREILTPKV